MGACSRTRTPRNELVQGDLLLQRDQVLKVVVMRGSWLKRPKVSPKLGAKFEPGTNELRNYSSCKKFDNGLSVLKRYE